MSITPNMGFIPGVILDRINGDLAGFIERIGGSATLPPLERLAADQGVKAGFIRFDPSSVKIKPGRIKLPGIGWVRAEGVETLASDTRLTRVEGRVGPRGWIVRTETERAA